MKFNVCKSKLIKLFQISKNEYFISSSKKVINTKFFIIAIASNKALSYNVNLKFLEILKTYLFLIYLKHFSNNSWGLNQFYKYESRSECSENKYFILNNQQNRVWFWLFLQLLIY